MLALDRAVARADAATRRWGRRLRADVGAARSMDPFAGVRETSTRTMYVALATYPDDPLAPGLARWVRRLALTRIAGGEIEAAAQARAALVVQVEHPEATTTSAGEVVRRVLGERAVGHREAWLSALGASRVAADVLSAEVKLDETLDEIGQRLGPGPEPTFAEPGAVQAAASAWLRATADLASDRLGVAGSPAALVDLLLARRVPGSWPSRLDARRLAELIDDGQLLHGVEPDLGPLPPALGATSVARALARFGAAWSRAAGPRGALFSLARDPSDLRHLTRGALFASLVAHGPFVRERFGLSRDDARDAVRSVALAFVGSLRLEASRAHARASRPRDAADALHDAWRVPVDERAVGAFPRVERRAPTRLVAAWLALDDARALISTFDDDWYRNPRALRALREREGTPSPPAPLLDADALTALATRAAAWAHEAAC